MPPSSRLYSGMGDLSTGLIGLLLLVPVVIAVGVACCAIKCSEWHFYITQKITTKKHKRNKSEAGSNTQNSTKSEDSTDLEKGIARS